MEEHDLVEIDVMRITPRSVLADFEVDDYVSYSSGPYSDRVEFGRVTGKNDTYVFVRFDGHGDTSKACRPTDLSKS